MRMRIMIHVKYTKKKGEGPASPLMLMRRNDDHDLWLYRKKREARRAPKVAAPEEATIGEAAPLLVAAD